MLVFQHANRAWRETGALSSRMETSDSAAEISDFLPRSRREEFLDNVTRIKEWIAAGDIYQANLSPSL